VKLSVKNAASVSLPAGKTDHLVFDDAIPGFGIRLREGGSKTWIFQYSVAHQQRRMVIGKATAIPADRARQIASELYAKVKLGHDPAADKAASKAAASLSFGSIAERFLARQKLRMRARSLTETARHILKNAKPLHKMPLAAIDRRSIAVLLGEIADANGPVEANRTRASLSALYTWAMKEGFGENNPILNTNRQVEQSRDRVLTDAELSVIWNVLDGNQYGDILKLLMFTGQRREEIAGLRWSEINFDKGILELPSSRTKNRRPHQIPMSGAVTAILQAQTKIENRDLVFGYANGPFQGWGEAKEKLDARIAATAGKPLAHWVLHDLRRTCATRMADLGVQPHIIEATLNHVSGHKGGIAGVYNRAVYSAEKAQALQLWATHIAAIVEGKGASNITALRRQA
jgi:integrase